MNLNPKEFETYLSDNRWINDLSPGGTQTRSFEGMSLADNSRLVVLQCGVAAS